MPRFATLFLIAVAAGAAVACTQAGRQPSEARPADSPPLRSARSQRQVLDLNANWRFFKAPEGASDDLAYEGRSEALSRERVRRAGAVPDAATPGGRSEGGLKPWILPSGNDFIASSEKRFVRPPGDPGHDYEFVRPEFNDAQWEKVDLPHDWAIAGPFLSGEQAAVGGSMGRLPSPGVGWYRRTIPVSKSDRGRSLFLEVDGAMSYSTVWLNGHLVGGWPFGYSSWQLDLTPFVLPGERNQLVIRLDNPPHSSRWYPGGGLYRDVRLIKTNAVHVAQWGTFVTTPQVSAREATVRVSTRIDNEGGKPVEVQVATRIYTLEDFARPSPSAVAALPPRTLTIAQGQSAQLTGSIALQQPRLWGPPPSQTPHRYLAVTTVSRAGKLLDRYETRFGIRSLRFDADDGLSINGVPVRLRGANLHHDLGALGAAFHPRAAERQLERLREMGCNAVRTAHNPPAPELLELTDRMGILVIDESFDVWERKKTPHDFHLIFPQWHEQDLRALVRRDRNHPSVIAWSIGNEVGEQYAGEAGAQLAARLVQIVREEDPTRPTTTAMNYAKPDMPLPAEVDVISLNYQGEGIRNGPGYAALEGIRTPPLYPQFHEKFPDKALISSENAAAVSSRGAYLFPVAQQTSAPVRDHLGGDPQARQVSAYELYTAPFGSSADKVFASLDSHPYVAGGFVWSGWDYLGEPTPYYLSRSSYFGAIDLAGFRKDRFFLYQAHWRPEHPMAHLLPHWNWPGRQGKRTPVHLFTSGDEAELFLNGRSLGRRRKGPRVYRLRWDEVRYEPGEIHAVAYKDGKPWASDRRQTTGPASELSVTVDRSTIAADGRDLAFVSVRVTDAKGRTVPTDASELSFQIEGPGRIVATDNGDPTDMTAFPSLARSAFHGRALAIVRGLRETPGTLQISVKSSFSATAQLSVQTVASALKEHLQRR